MDSKDLECSVCLGKQLNAGCAFFKDKLQYCCFLGIFEVPIRTTLCGHNFCEKCLLFVSKGEEEWSCPECRRVHNCSVDHIARGYLIEKYVEKFKNNQFEVEYCEKHNSVTQISKFFD